MISTVLFLLLTVPNTNERLLPAIPLADFRGTEAHALDDYLGQVVLIDFFAHWCAPCAKQVPHLNELVAAHGARGLNVLGVTGDDERTAGEWLMRLGADYPHARDPELALEVELGFQPLPSAVLVDPFGVILWQGNPAELPLERLETALKEALPAPAYRWPASAIGVREALRRKQYAEAERSAKAAPEQADELTGFVTGFVRRRIDLMDSALGNQDFLTASELAAELEAGLAPGDPLVHAGAVRAEIAADPASGPVLTAQRALLDLWSRVGTLRTKKEADALAAAIQSLAEVYGGTQVERSAAEYGKALESLKVTLP